MNARPEAKAATRGAAVVAAVALLVGTVQGISGSARFTTQAGRSWASAVVFLAAAAALVAAGVVGAGRRRGALVSVPPLVAAVAWVAPVWSARAGSDLVRSAADVIAALLFGAVVQVGLTAPAWRLSSQVRHAVVSGAYVVSGGAAVVLALVRDPYLDRGCLANCDINVFLIAAHPRLADAVQSAGRWGEIAVSGALVALCAVELATSSPAARRRIAPLIVPFVLLAAAVAARGLLLEWRQVDNPNDNVMFAAFLVAAAALLFVGVALVVDQARRSWQRRSVAQVAADVADVPQPGSLEAALRRSVLDPDLSIAYWMADRGIWADATGHTVAEPSAKTGGRQLTRLTRGDETLAVISHSDAVPELADHLGPAMLLGLENERLQAGVLAHLADIRDSRSRIVEAGDAERRRLERDLHDGAQQQLLAVSLDLRMAQAGAVSSPASGARMEDAVGEMQLALAELRELAHGIYPAALDEIGLAGALETLAETAPLPVDVSADVELRWPPKVETAAYFAVVEAIDAASRRRASYVVIEVAGDMGHLVATVRDNGERIGAPPVELIDRVVALGGEVQPVDDGWRMELPCG